ncbi:MAG: ComEC/Rec2 family competence protein, partial [Bacteroidota bacterium]
DYRQYLAYNNIHHQDFVNRDKWTISNRASGFSLVGISIKIRNKLEQVLARYIHQPEELAIAKALILGNKEDLDKSTKETFATAGAMHVLAVSGLHVGIIYLVLISLLGQKRSNITKPVLIAVIVIPILWLYAFITGLSPSVLRAVTMFSFLTLAHVFGRRSNTLNILAISAFILLMFNPYMIMAVGFQLSYVAVIGIIFLFPVIERRITPSNQVLRVVWQITALSVAAQLATFPLSALYFHRFPTYFLISNLVVIPAATLIIWGGLLLLLAGSISGFLGSIIGSGVGFIIGIVNTVLKSMTQWPYADIQNLVPSIFESWITYGIIILFFLFLIEKKRLYYHLSLAAIIVLVANLFYWEIKGNNLRQVTIYSIHNRWAIDLIENRKYQTITDSLLSTETSKIDFHITPYRRQFNLQIDNRSIKTRKTQWGDAFVWHGKKILLADPCINSIELPEIFDLLLIKPAVSSYDCYQEQIVLRKLVEDQQIHFEEHNLKKEGALIINL